MKVMGSLHPVLIHPRFSKISTSYLDFLERMNYYAEKVSEYTEDPNFKLILILSDDQKEIIELKTFRFLEVYAISKPTLNYFKFARETFDQLRKLNIFPSLIIAGDLTIGLLSALRLQKIIPGSVPIQASIHGSITSNSKFPSFKALNSFLIRRLLRNVQSIRVVSPSVENEILSIPKLNQKSIFIAPIPFMEFPTYSERTEIPVTVAVIGRLHEERNVSEILKILNSFLKSVSCAKIWIIGDGPLRKEVETWSSNHSASQIKLFGNISHSRVIQMLPEIDVVLSSAEKEGYGLTIREALISGAFVVARKNKGTDEVKNIFAERMFLYTEVENAISVLEQLFTGRLSVSSFVDYTSIQRSIDKNSLINIANSWNPN